MPITLPFTFTNGTVADATQVNANMSALANGALSATGNQTITGDLAVSGRTRFGVPTEATIDGTNGRAYLNGLDLYVPTTGTTGVPCLNFDIGPSPAEWQFGINPSTRWIGLWGTPTNATELWMGPNGEFSLFRGAAPILSIDTTGNMNFVGNITAANFPSEARFKRNVADYPTGLDAVCALRPVSWEWNGLGGINDPHRPVQYGVMADEAEAVLPEAIGTRVMELGQVKTLDDRPVLYAVVNAIRELADRIEAIERRI